MSTSNVTRAINYAKRVVGGRIVAGKYIKLSCRKFLREIDQSKKDKASPFEFDLENAEAALEFIQEMHHVKGEWAERKEKLNLEPWQCYFVANIFGWYTRATGWRRYRIALLFVARKNAKTTLAAGIGNYMLTADGEYGAEVYSGATSEAQAWEVFGAAKTMAEMNEPFRDYYAVQVNASNLQVPATNSKFTTLIGKPGEGANVHCAIHDEYHEHKTNAQIFSMRQGMGSRRNPLQLIITTAGEDLTSPCYQMVAEGRDILDGVYQDEHFFPLLYMRDAGNENTGEKGDAWDSITAMKKANPNLGVSVYEQGLRDELAAAKRNPEKEMAYRTKKLNEFVGAKQAYFPIHDWDQCEKPGIKIDDFADRDVIMAVDLASRIDLAALEILFLLGKNDGGQDTFALFSRFWCPEAAARDNPKYKMWAEQGWLTATPGEIIDFNFIQVEIEALCQKLQVLEIAFDPHQATMIMVNLVNQGINCIEIPQRTLYLSEPMKALQADIIAHNIQHDGNPIFRWMLGNVVAKKDAKETVYPRKERDESKIDGPVAAIMARGRADNHELADISGLFDPVVIDV